MHTLGLGISGFEHNPYSSVSSGCRTPYWELGGGVGWGYSRGFCGCASARRRFVPCVRRVLYSNWYPVL